MSLEKKIELVKSEMFSRFPNCNYTIRILLWDDGTDLVECRYGDGEKIHNVIYYNNELTYESLDALYNSIRIDETGKEYCIRD